MYINCGGVVVKILLLFVCPCFHFHRQFHYLVYCSPITPIE